MYCEFGEKVLTLAKSRGSLVRGYVIDFISKKTGKKLCKCANFLHYVAYSYTTHCEEARVLSRAS